MSSLTSVGDTVTLTVPAKNEQILVSISGTYDMTLKLQREMGSPGSGAWETLKTWSTANATVAYTHTSKSPDERLRVIVDVDTSGTAVVTLADNSNKDIKVWSDLVGNILAKLTQKGMVLYGTLSRDGGVVDVTAATVTLNAEDHAGKVVTLNRAAGVTATLPAAVGSGNVYTLFTGTTVSSNANVVQAASSSDSMGGGVAIATDIAGVVMLCAATTDTISQNGTTTGGVIGSWLKITDVASGKFMVEGFLASTGAEATPFSAAV